LRPGYLWRGQVVRYAEVRATRAAARCQDAEEATPAEDEVWKVVSEENTVDEEFA
jgi:hypothetical protein